MTKALVLTSDIKMSATLKVFLTFNRFTAVLAHNIDEARKHLEEIHFDILIVDIHNQSASTFKFINSLRSEGLYTPTLFVGERAYEEALQIGSSALDEYLLKPFSFPELKNRLANLLNKAHSEKKPLLYGGINVDVHRQIIQVADNFIELGNMEMRILLLLARKAGAVVSLDTVHSMLESEGVRFNTTLFTHISKLRKKLTDVSGNQMQIIFVRDGYRLHVSSS